MLFTVLNMNSMWLVCSVQVANLASKALAMALRDLSDLRDDQHGYRPVLCDAFVDLTLCDGACYKMTNWESIGMMPGTDRPDQRRIISVTSLDPDCRTMATPFSRQTGRQMSRTRRRRSPRNTLYRYFVDQTM